MIPFFSGKEKADSSETASSQLDKGKTKSKPVKKSVKEPELDDSLLDGDLASFDEIDAHLREGR